MVLYVKNKFISLGDSSFAVDENGNNVFQIQGKVFSPTKKKFVYDTAGNLLYTVRNKYWHLFMKKALIYDASGKKYAKVKERFFSPAMLIKNCPDQLEMVTKGLFKGITVIKNGKEIGKWSFGSQTIGDVFRDSYRVEVYDDAEAALLVALTIAVDNIHDDRKK